MHRPDHPTAQSGRFTDGDPGQGIDATVIQASWLNDALLEELVGVVEGAGLTLDKNNPAQLLEAVNQLAAARSGRKNLIFNPSFDVWQLGESTASASDWEMGPDGWYSNPYSSKITCTKQAFAAGQTVVPGFPRYFGRFAKDASVPTQAPAVACFVEDVRPWGDQDVTVSFWAKADTNTNIDLAGVASYGTGTSSPQDGDLTPLTITTAWTKYTHTFRMPTNENKDIREDSHLRFEWRLPDDSSVVSLDIAQVQVEPGTAATAFVGPTEAEARQRAERYLEKSWPVEGQWGTDAIFELDEEGVAAGYAEGTALYALQTNFRARKAKSPTVTWYSPNASISNAVGNAAGGTINVTSTIPSVEGTGYPTAGSAQVAGAFLAQWLAEAHLF